MIDLDEFILHSPGRRIAVLGRLTMSLMAASLKELGISRGQIGFILEVLQHDGIVQEELSEHMFIDRAATARALSELERKGLVRRVPDEKDRRKKRVYPTETAVAMQENLLTVLMQNNETLFKGLSPDERTRFLDMLDTLIGNLRSALSEKE